MDSTRIEQKSKVFMDLWFRLLVVNKNQKGKNAGLTIMFDHFHDGFPFLILWWNLYPENGSFKNHEKSLFLGALIFFYSLMNQQGESAFIFIWILQVFLKAILVPIHYDVFFLLLLIQQLIWHNPLLLDHKQDRMVLIPFLAYI